MSTSSPDREAARTNQELREEAKARMVKAAIELVAEKGASRLTLAEVGRKAGYSHTLPNYYFKNKTNLLLLVYASITARFRDHMKSWTRTRPTPQRKMGLASLMTMVQGYMEGSKTSSPRARATHALLAESCSAMPELLEDVRQSNTESRATIAAYVRAGIERGEIREDVDADALAVIVIGTLRGAVSQKLIDADNTDMERVAHTLLDLLQHGLQRLGEQNDSATKMSAADVLDI